MKTELREDIIFQTVKKHTFKMKLLFTDLGKSYARGCTG